MEHPSHRFSRRLVVRCAPLLYYGLAARRKYVIVRLQVHVVSNMEHHKAPHIEPRNVNVSYAKSRSFFDELHAVEHSVYAEE